MRSLTAAGEKIVLSPKENCRGAREFAAELSRRVIGQESAVSYVSDLFQVFLAGLGAPDRPVGAMLFLGPTGTGKTRVVEAAAEVLFGDPNAVIKIDCAEFQHSHEIAKLIGSPPGYVGHRETNPVLTQENLERFQTEDVKLSLVLFDEIEKASESLWQLLLGVLDKATLTLADNRRVDFSRAVVVMTSNLGAREISELLTGGLGFAPASRTGRADEAELDRKMHASALGAAQRRFSPEFMNRLDKVVVFQSLREEHLRQILDLELDAVRRRVLDSDGASFSFECSDEAKELMLREGCDSKYGARHLKRAVERLLVFPLSRLLASRQIEAGDHVHVELEEGGGELSFAKIPGAAIVTEAARGEEWQPPRRGPRRSAYADAGLPNVSDFGTAWGMVA
jgi:ATP-dependent Clp protease ATP-binding subunit ClpB